MVGPKQNQHENNRWRWASRSGGLFMLLAVTAFLRFFKLGIKPPHFDEGINGHFVLTIWRDGFYSYDPTNFHGPLYFYLCHLAEVLFGRGVDSFRVMNGALSLLLVFSIFRFRRFVGGTAVLAAWVLALSPAFSFYGRYAIHETLFILGQVFFVFGRFLWMGRPSRVAFGWMAAGVVILVTTKETFFIFLGTWLIAEGAVWWLEKAETRWFTKTARPWSTYGKLTEAERRVLRVEVAAITGIAILAVAALFSGFFEHPRGLVDFFRAFTFWSKTGTEGNGHQKPFFYWIEIFWRYEWALLAGLVISGFATICLGNEGRKQRILLLAGFGSVLAYSLIRYKTPWLVLGFWPLAFFGHSIFDNGRAKYIFRPLIAALLVAASVQSWRLNFENYADAKEPYVYVQTTTDYRAVMDVLTKKIERSPEARNLSIVVMIQDPWPLPFDLSLYPKMRYAKLEDIEKDPSILADAGLLLMDGSLLPGLRHVFPKRFGRMKFQLRDAYAPGWALFDFDAFQMVLPPGVDIEDVARSNDIEDVAPTAGERDAR